MKIKSQIVMYINISKNNCYYGNMFVVFSGQGSQKQGMGRQFCLKEVEYYTNLASNIINQDISYLLNEASDEELNKTQNAQIAIFTLSYAITKHLLNNGLHIRMMAGHSLGQYVAMAISEIITFQEACEFIFQRAKLMAKIEGKMIALLGCSLNEAQMIANLSCVNDNFCFVANHNSRTQVVLSGKEEAINNAQKIAKKSIILNTSGPFHSPYMQKTNQEISQIIEKIYFKEPKIQIISNINANSEVNWKNETKNHMVACVRWFETMEIAKQYEVLEIGALPILTNMAKRDGINIKHVKDIL